MDFARSCNYQKRGAGARPVRLDENLVVSHHKSADILALDDALEALTGVDPWKANVVELKFFGGFETEEMAELLQGVPSNGAPGLEAC